MAKVSSISHVGFSFYKIILLFMAFATLKCWVFWSIPDMLLYLGFLAITIMFFPLTRCSFDLNNQKKKIIALLILITFIINAGLGNLNLYLVAVASASSLCVLVLLNDDCLIELLSLFQKVLVVILAISLIFWILHLMGINPPSYELAYGEVEVNGINEDQYLFQNYYFYLENRSWMLTGNIDGIIGTIRFHSVFLEPGYLGILMVFLLTINKFNWKEKRNWVYIITLLFSLSLAGFVMLGFSYITHKMRYSHKKVLIILLLIIGGFLFYLFFSNYQGGHNVINEGIIERLQYDEEKGIAGNNRSTNYLDKQFDQFMMSSNVFFGYPRDEKFEAGVGIKAYLVRYGFIGLFLFLLYMYQLAKKCNRYQGYILLILYIMMFLRGQVTMFWMGFMLVYVAGLALIKRENEKNCVSRTLQRV